MERLGKWESSSLPMDRRRSVLNARISKLEDYLEPYIYDTRGPQVVYYSKFWMQLADSPTGAELLLIDGAVEKWMDT